MGDKRRGSNIAILHKKRELNDQFSQRFKRAMHVTRKWISQLDLEKELDGHSGCVNCLEWNDSGNLLLSGSDDQHIVLWYPFKYKKLLTLPSGHHGNIFSVKFLPRSGDQTIVTGAGDCRIHVHDLGTQELTQSCSCHTARVKRLAVSPDSPYLFWSAAEDGLILQFDLRIPHHCSNECDNVLVNLTNHLGRSAEAKCLAINPLRPEMLAVGANDPYVRLYDRRMISPSSYRIPSLSPGRSNWERHNLLSSQPDACGLCDNLPLTGCVQYFVAGHLPRKIADYEKRHRSLASTYVTFSPDGGDLLVNLGGEQIYLFNLYDRQRPSFVEFPPAFLSAHQNGMCKVEVGSSNGYRNGTTANGFSRSHPPFSTMSPLLLDVEELKEKANSLFEKQLYSRAISMYNEAITLSPSPILYGNRAAALMKRNWDGDVYAALKDCLKALQLDSGHFKALFRLARCLHEMDLAHEASQCLQVFKTKFPEQASSSTFLALDKDISFSIQSASSSSSVSHQDDSEGEDWLEQEKEGGRKTPVVFGGISDEERRWRQEAWDYTSRFCGHCNTTTDIKEANFFGSKGEYIVAGSDEGSFFVWDRETGNIVQVLRGDESIVNVIQPHPSLCLLATSGIEHVIRLWSPRPDEEKGSEHQVKDLDGVASANQKRMNTDPLEVMLLNMGHHFRSMRSLEEVGEDLIQNANIGDTNIHTTCRTS
ncbi:unnamed protein product [Darwinula stevensoni]|uniref:WD and tetratricopeptide repeats protein 1 n=1 Tax=Darwinula stevensoni TaxID=69355 RepID=A0A7R9FQ98_9CRUS|nr:unnamed protein product [Darwinula stevensoni]CAG0898801.1 unnamed protein product [Darwinula stevensoni]